MTISPGSGIFDAFARFEREGWERVAPRYEELWTSLSAQFAGPLLAAANVRRGQRVLDLCCGPGVVSAAAHRLGALVTGLDFSRAMVERARAGQPGIEFREGDAQALPFADGSFDRVVMNFGVLHLPYPDRAFTEARRVLAPGGRFGFTVWVAPTEETGWKILEEAVKGHAVQPPDLPPGPDRNLFASAATCRAALRAAGFDDGSMTFATERVTWTVPTPGYLFEAARDGGVRTGGVLARQSPERLARIREAVERAVARYRTPAGYAIPMGAHVVTAARP